MLRALSWLARTARMEALLNMVSNAIIQAFGWSGSLQPTDRKEALPLPMACVVAWEELVCNPASGTQLVLLLGAFLLAYHACLRFGDLQRIRLSSLSLTAQSLRGICWSTKTSCTGQPFAVTLTGLSGRCAVSSWCLNNLLCLHRCWLATEAFWRSDV